jgi:hypothetical protein
MFGLQSAQIWENGVLGSAIFWFGWALDLIPLAVIAYTIYVASLLGDGYWRSAVGAGPLACAILLILFAFADLVLQLFGQFNILAAFKHYQRFGRIAAFFAAFLLLGIFLSFFTPTAYERNWLNFWEYAQLYRDSDAQAAEYWATLNASDQAGLYPIRQFIWDRSVNPREGLLSFAVAWLALFSLHVFALNVVESDAALPDQQPLHPGQNTSDDPA